MLEENSIKTELNEDSKGLKRKCDEMCSSQDSCNDGDQKLNLCNNEVTAEPPVKKLSKKEQRRMRKREAWLAHKPEKRAKEREKLKAKRLEAKMKNVDLGPNRKSLKSKTMANSACKVHAVVDMSFDDYMNDRDLSKCVKQLLRCYTLNRRADEPMQLFFTSFNGKCKMHMEKNNGYKNWDVNFKEDYLTDVFPKEKIVYLSSDSPNTVLNLEEDKVYVIGGLVDHNVHKGLCHKIAEEKGINHAQLPIGEFLKMNSRKVLTIDHVFEILLNVSTGLSWEDAFLKVIPKRKGALPKAEEDEKLIKGENLCDAEDLNKTDSSDVEDTNYNKNSCDIEGTIIKNEDSDNKVVGDTTSPKPGRENELCTSDQELDSEKCKKMANDSANPVTDSDNHPES